SHPTHRPHLGVAQLPGGERIPNERQLTQPPPHPQLLPRRLEPDATPVREPVGTGLKPPSCPPLPPLELAEQQQPPALPRRQMPRQLTDLRLQPLQRNLGADLDDRHSPAPPRSGPN